MNKKKYMKPLLEIEEMKLQSLVALSFDEGTTNKMEELPPVQFDWDNMPDEITTDSPQECIDAISQLMLYCGHAHDMNYSVSGSGAYSYLIPQRVPMYFGYANTMHYVYRKSYSEQEWDSLLVKELVNNLCTTPDGRKDKEHGKTRND